MKEEAYINEIQKSTVLLYTVANNGIVVIEMKGAIVKGFALGLVFVLLLSGSAGIASAFSNSGGGDCNYYKEIPVKDNSGKTLTDFQVLVELNY